MFGGYSYNERRALTLGCREPGSEGWRPADAGVGRRERRHQEGDGRSATSSSTCRCAFRRFRSARSLATRMLKAGVRRRSNRCGELLTSLSDSCRRKEGGAIRPPFLYFGKSRLRPARPGAFADMGLRFRRQKAWFLPPGLLGAWGDGLLVAGMEGSGAEFLSRPGFGLRLSYRTHPRHHGPRRRTR